MCSRDELLRVCGYATTSDPFSKFIGNCSAYAAKLWGVLEDLKYAWNLGFRRVELHIDSQIVVRIIQEETRVNSSC
jgi:ribonuclease HI